MSSQNQNHGNANRFNLVVTGVGYLNASYEVTPQRGKPYLAVKITGLEGEAGPEVKPNQVKFDCIVTALAKEDVDFIEQLLLDLNLDNPKVIAAFRIGITGINSFQKNDGSLGTAIRGRLIRLTSVSVNGEKYELPSAQAPEASEELPAVEEKAVALAGLDRTASAAVPTTRPTRELARTQPQAPQAAPRQNRVPTAALSARLAQQGAHRTAAAPRAFAK